MSKLDSEIPDVTPDLFRPSVGRAWLTAVFAVAAFFIPQKIPLEWYPLNNPSSGLRYLEITCAANATGNVRIYLQGIRGNNDLDAIGWPIGPSEMAYTYTFPLPDMPLNGLRVYPLDQPGELRITNFRLLNRRGEELRRFICGSFTTNAGVEIMPTKEGWRMTEFRRSGVWEWASIDFGHYTAAEGMNTRNLQRCLLSTSYLALMLWILLLAVFFAFRRPEPWRKTIASMAFLALLGVLFSFVGNRGLIRNSVRYSLVELPPRSSKLTLEMDVTVSCPAVAQLFWDTGEGFSEKDSCISPLGDSPNEQTLRFPLPEKTIAALRFDPLDRSGRLNVRRVRLVDGNGDVRCTFDADAFESVQQIATLKKQEETMVIETTPNAGDPILMVKPKPLAQLNQVRSAISK